MPTAVPPQRPATRQDTPRAWPARQPVLLVVPLALLAGGAALATGNRTWQSAALGIGTALVLAAVYRLMYGGDVQASRSLSTPLVTWGHTLTQTIALTNRSRVQLAAVRVEDQSTLPQYPSGYVTTLPPRQTMTWEVAVPCRTRGRYQLGPVTTHTSDPLGLFPAVRTLGEAASVVVLPRWVPLGRCVLPLDGQLAGEARGRHRGEAPPTLASVRDYTAGDPLAAIHWPASARTGQLMTKLFAPEVQTPVWLLLDLDREPGGLGQARRKDAPGRDARQVQIPSHDEGELLVTLTTSLALYALQRAHLRVGLMVLGMPAALVLPERGKLQAHRVMEVLAEVQPGTCFTRADLVARLDRGLGTGHVLVLLTARGPARWEAWLGRLRRRGVAPRVLHVVSSQPEPADREAPTSRLARGEPAWSVPTLDVPLTLGEPAQHAALREYLEGRSATRETNETIAAGGASLSRAVRLGRR
jgi:uncharacterized protein (DUF58 family)